MKLTSEQKKILAMLKKTMKPGQFIYVEK